MDPDANRADVHSIDKLIGETRRLAAEYRRATGKPLAVSAEIARYDAARLLGLELVEAAEPVGYDAIGTGPRAGQRIQIKGRAIFDGQQSRARIGQIRPQAPWDCLVLVLMDEQFEPREIYAADRDTVLGALAQTGGAGEGGRASRGALSVARFKRIAEQVWTG